VRFEPGERKTVSLVQVGGKKLLSGGSGLGVGEFVESKMESILENVQKGGFSHKKQERVEEGTVPEMDREVVCGSSFRRFPLTLAVRFDVWSYHG
jgi:urease